MTKQCADEFSQNETRMYYLNDSSTKYLESHNLNLSDSLYKENIDDRRRVIQLEEKIKRLVHAPSNSSVIFNSGSSESIATCIHWAKAINPFGIVVGTEFDHDSVKDNCMNYDIKYVKSNMSSLSSLDDRCCVLFLTHVDGKTGEIMDVGKITKDMDYDYLQYFSGDDSGAMFNKKVMQYKPFIFLDATQSIMKVPIDMERWNIDGVFWSNHKLGGNMRSGVLVVREEVGREFVPLIAGAQQHHMRGGSISAKNILEDSFIYDYRDDVSKRRDEWTAAYQFLKNNGVNVYTPHRKHLFNTLLIDTGSKCPLSILSELAERNIYVSPKSACAIDRQLDSKGSGETVSGGSVAKNPFDNSLRISFTDGSQLNDYVLDNIVDVMHEAFQ